VAAIKLLPFIYQENSIHENFNTTVTIGKMFTIVNVSGQMRSGIQQYTCKGLKCIPGIEY